MTFVYVSSGAFNIASCPEDTLVAQLWGAYGGGIGDLSSKPGYIKVKVTGLLGKTMQIIVGGHTTDYKGGIFGGGTATETIGFGGGGATSIRVYDTSAAQIIAVAGGGGGYATDTSGNKLGGVGGGGDADTKNIGGKGAFGITPGHGGLLRPAATISRGTNDGTASTSIAIGVGGSGLRSGGGGGLAGGGGGGNYFTSYGGAGGGSNGTRSVSGVTSGLLSSTMGSSTRPQVGSLYDGYAQLLFFNPTAAPTVTITQPTDGSNFVLGGTVTLAGTAFDNLNGNLNPSLIWTSNGQLLGTGTPLSFSTGVLSSTIGTFTITAQATNSLGNTGSASIQINLISPSVLQIQIAVPTDGEFIPDNMNEAALEANASDSVEIINPANIVWSSSVDGFIGNGSPFPIGQPGFPALTANSLHVLTASIINSFGVTATDQVTVAVGPGVYSVHVTSPVTITTFNETETILWSAVGTGQAGIQSDLLKWYRPGPVQFGSGGYFTTLANIFPVGQTTQITVVMTDEFNPGPPATALINVTVLSDPLPDITILQPTTSGPFYQGNPIFFSATANDFPAADISANIEWSSDIDGPLHTGASFTTSSLSVNYHRITASVLSSRGDNGKVFSVSVLPLQPPPVSITQPADNLTFELLDSITFIGTAISSDFMTNISSSLEWWSDLIGSFGGGAIVPRTAGDLGVGQHTITAKVTDSFGRLGSDSIIVNIVAMICLHESSAMQLASGDWVSISSLRAGDLVMDYRGQPVPVINNIKFPRKARTYVSLLDRASGEMLRILPGHALLIEGKEYSPEQLSNCNTFACSREDNVAGHIYTLCTERRTFVRAGPGFSVATWSEDGFDNFIENDVVGQNLGAFSRL